MVLIAGLFFTNTTVQLTISKKKEEEFRCFGTLEFLARVQWWKKLEIHKIV